MMVGGAEDFSKDSGSTFMPSVEARGKVLP